MRRPPRSPENGRQQEIGVFPKRKDFDRILVALRGVDVELQPADSKASQIQSR
jgi:hypothetical protein